MKTPLIICLMLSGVLLTGCVGMVVPVPGDGKTHGKVIRSEQVQFIVPGQTTRAEVVQALGCEFRASPRLPALAYSWEEPAAGLLWFWLAVPYGPADGDFTERTHWRAFFVAFDNTGMVSRTKFAALSGRQSLDEQLERWAGRRHEHFWDEGCHVFNPDTGSPILVEAAFNHLSERNKR